MPEEPLGWNSKNRLGPLFAKPCDKIQIRKRKIASVLSGLPHLEHDLATKPPPQGSQEYSTGTGLSLQYVAVGKLDNHTLKNETKVVCLWE